MKKRRIAVIGLGYVGLPLAVEFSRYFQVTGLDLNAKRIQELQAFEDNTHEVHQDVLQQSTMKYTSTVDDIAPCSVYIITVPTPVDAHKKPDMSYLRQASQSVGRVLKKGDLVVYESTVYPGATKEFCAPILETQSQLVVNKDFGVGYSPERINPGDDQHRFQNIEKVVSASNAVYLKQMVDLYGTVVQAPLHQAPSIEVAEASKLVENIQRDINVGLMNELSCLFHALSIDTQAVLAAANTKWNFLNFKPGLVGGHCIGVDPYYMSHKANEVGFVPQMLLVGRAINERMSTHIVQRVIHSMVKKGVNFQNARVLVLGCTFKENCPDCRNSKVFDMIDQFLNYYLTVHVYDPWVQVDERVKRVTFISEITQQYNAIVVAVAHDQFIGMGETLKKHSTDNGTVFDVKGILEPQYADESL